MFIEPFANTGRKRGWIEVITGSMFSGKTEELIRRLKRAQLANQKVEIFKPTIDSRYDEVQIVSHNANRIQSTPVDNSNHILLYGATVDVVGLDEAQFFDQEIVNVAVQLANNGVRVICAGLDMDYLGVPFGPMPALMGVAEYVTKVHAICMVCGDIATHSFRMVSNDSQVMLGELDTYQARCRNCFQEGMQQK